MIAEAANPGSDPVAAADERQRNLVHPVRRLFCPPASGRHPALVTMSSS